MNQNIVEAITSILAADASIVSAYPAGWNNSEAPPSADLAYGVFEKAGTSSLLITGGGRLENITVNFNSFATTATACEALGELLKSRLLPTRTFTPIKVLFAGGAEFGRFKGPGEQTAIDPERGPYNTDVWRNTIPIVWQVAYQ
jgi:hypothetical protein